MTISETDRFIVRVESNYPIRVDFLEKKKDRYVCEWVENDKYLIENWFMYYDEEGEKVFTSDVNGITGYEAKTLQDIEKYMDEIYVKEDLGLY